MADLFPATCTASEVNMAIRAKYSGPEWRVWFEVNQGTGMSTGRRADAVVMNIWPSKAYQLHVFEVKVSRADFKAEMADLTKWQAVGQYADFFWLACPVGLVSADEVPEAWGLMELTKAGLRIKKQAPARDAAPLDRAFAASLLRSGEDLTEKEIERRAQERAEAKVSAALEREKARHDRALSIQRERSDKLEAWCKEFEAEHGTRPQVHRPAAEMATRLALASSLEHGRLAQLASQARHLAESIDKLAPKPEPVAPYPAPQVTP